MASDIALDLRVQLGLQRSRRGRTLDSAKSEFARAIVDGLSSTPKHLPCRYFYDARGSALFEEITRLPEYYPTRTETAILSHSASEMVCGIDPRDTVLVEFGSGSSTKTEILLRALPNLAAYVPVDVSSSALSDATDRLAANLPDLTVIPVVGDFTRLEHVPLPDVAAARQRLGFFPGSTIGNFDRDEAISVLAGFAHVLGSGGELLIGVDLVKPLNVLLPAYDDARGVTAAFNMNLLVRIARTFGPAFDLGRFRHRAIWNPDLQRIEMHLVSMTTQTVSLLGHEFSFAAGETIHTESSHKYDVDGFGDLARAAGWTTSGVWSDPENWFAVFRLRRTG